MGARKGLASGVLSLCQVRSWRFAPDNQEAGQG